MICGNLLIGKVVMGQLEVRVKGKVAMGQIKVKVISALIFQKVRMKQACLSCGNYYYWWIRTKRYQPNQTCRNLGWRTWASGSSTYTLVSGPWPRWRQARGSWWNSITNMSSRWISSYPCILVSLYPRILLSLYPHILISSFLITSYPQVASSGFFKSTLASSEAQQQQQQQYFPLLPQPIILPHTVQPDPGGGINQGR